MAACLPSPASEQLSADFQLRYRLRAFFPSTRRMEFVLRLEVLLEAIERDRANRNVESAANEAIYSRDHETVVGRRRESVRRETSFRFCPAG